MTDEAHSFFDVQQAAHTSAVQCVTAATDGSAGSKWQAEQYMAQAQVWATLSQAAAIMHVGNKVGRGASVVAAKLGEPR